MFFKDLFRHCHDFEFKLNTDFGHAETGSEAKKRVVLRREFFSLEHSSGVRNQCVNKSSLSRGFLLTCCNFTLILLFFEILNRIFFSKWFSNPFIVHSRSSFLFEPICFFLLLVFFTHAAY